MGLSNTVLVVYTVKNLGLALSVATTYGHVGYSTEDVVAKAMLGVHIRAIAAGSQRGRRVHGDVLAGGETRQPEGPVALETIKEAVAQQRRPLDAKRKEA